MRSVTVYKEVDVEVDVDMEDFADEELIEELEERGYVIHSKKEYTSDIDYLYSTWLTCSKEMFEKQLKDFFRTNLGHV